MSNIFTLPVITRDPGDKLYFFQTGTTTPQNTYSDAGLTTPHDNPVEADAGGEFPVIYLNPSLPDYRVRLTDSSDVQVWQKDNIAATAAESTSYRIKSALPTLIIEETDASTDEGKWKIKSSGGVLTMSLLDDAEATETPFLTVTRTGDTVDSVEIAGDSSGESGSFTATLTGFSGTVTGTVNYQRTGDIVMLCAPSAISGTSNTTSLVLSGIPVALRPSSTAVGFVTCTINAGNSGRLSIASISSAGEITFEIYSSITASPSSSGFTNTGTKGLQAGWSLSYLLV